MPPAKTEPRRADAERNVEAILDAATKLLADKPNVSMAEVAREAGVVRATLYGHFPSRRELVEAAVDRAVADAAALMDAARIDEGPPAEALDRMIDASWAVLERHRTLAAAAVDTIGNVELQDRHWPLHDRVRELIERGQASGDFRDDLPADWLVATVFGVVHTARDEANAGRLAPENASAVLKATIGAALHSSA
jgi:TetR/AcrR family transcriptional regulator, mexCD-oprJ operon repressor